MPYEISLDPERLQLDVIYAFLSTSYWSPDIRREIMEKAIQNSLIVGAYESESGVQIGFARAVTDYATFAWLSDVYVAETHRKQGIAKAMVRALMEHSELQTLRRWVLATRDAQSLYKELGFDLAPEGRFMMYKLPEEVWKVENSPKSHSDVL